MHQDAELIARCQRADASAFDAIVARYKTKIYHYLYRMTGNAEDADDLTQEVFDLRSHEIEHFFCQCRLHPNPECVVHNDIGIC